MPYDMPAGSYLNMERAIELNIRLSAATQRALAALKEEITTRRLYELRQKEFKVILAFIRRIKEC